MMTLCRRSSAVRARPMSFRLTAAAKSLLAERIAPIISSVRFGTAVTTASWSRASMTASVASTSPRSRVVMRVYAPGFASTSPVSTSLASASRTGVLLKPRYSASSLSLIFEPGASSPVTIASRMRSRAMSLIRARSTGLPPRNILDIVLCSLPAAGQPETTIEGCLRASATRRSRARARIVAGSMI